MKKIELNILYLYLIESIIIIFLFKENILDIIIGFSIAYLINCVLKRIKFNVFSRILYLIILVFISFVLLYKIVFFISYNILKNYSIILITFSFLLTVFYTIKAKSHIYIKTIELSFYSYLLIKFLKIILTIPLIKVDNINFINQLFISYKTIYISIISFFIIRLIFLITNYIPTIKNIIIPLLNPIIIKIISILIIGNTLFHRYQYPYVNYLKRIRYLNFIERVEGILSYEYLLCFFILFSFIVYSIKNIIIQLKKPIK